MRTFIFLCCTFVFSLAPNDLVSQNSKVKVEEDKVLTVDEVFQLIMEQTDYKFFYEKGIFNDFPKVKINKGTISVNKLLKQSLSQKNLDVTLTDNDAILIKEKETSLLDQAQQIEVSGVVTGPSGQPMPGATILEKGTTNGTQTDFDGNFTIKVSNKYAILVVSYVGYFSQEVLVDDSESISITLKEDTTELQEIIVVGYTAKKKSDVTSSVAKVTSEELKDITAPNVSTMLQGKASGVQVVQGSGQPGASPTIRIRGVSSISSSNDPLWVVDGVIVHSVPNLDPNEIENISVLKDASATSLYGSRGSNGVIVVTTKRGKTGKTQLTISSKTGFSIFNQGNFEVMNSQQLYDYYGLFANQNAIPSWYTPELLNTDYNWLKNGTQTGVIKDHSLTLSTGNDVSKTFVLLGYYDETGTVKGYQYDRLSLRVNHEVKVMDKLTIKPKLAVNYTNRDNKQHSLYQMYNNLPWDKPFDENGNVRNPQEPGVTWYGRDQSNYYEGLQTNYSKGSEFNLFADFDFELDLFKNVKFISTNGYTLFMTNGMSYTDPLSNAGKAKNGELSNSNAKRITRFTNQMIRYNNTFGNLRVNALAAYEYNDYVYESFFAEKYNLVSGTEILDNASEPGNVGGTKNDYALQSYLFNAELIYDDRYMAQFSIRRDGASNFGDNNKYGNFFSVSGGWNIHKENFFNVPWVNALKLRASYGSVGNRPTFNYPQYSYYSLLSTYNAAPTTTPGQLGNDDLLWEVSYQTDVAIDARIFNKLGLTLEYYKRDTSDLIQRVSLPATAGYSYQYQNVGAVVNEGVEAIANLDLFENADGFNWNVSFNIGANKNKITELYQGEDQFSGSKIRREGLDSNSWYLRKWLGVNPSTGKPLWEVIDENTGEKSTTSDVEKATRQVVGTSTPDFFGGFTTKFSYKGLSLNANFTFVKGGKIYNSTRELFDSSGAYPTYNQMVLPDEWSIWQQPGDYATHPLPYYGGDGSSNKTSSRYLEDGSFLRMRNITLNYSLDPDLVKAIGLSSASLYISGDNLLTFTGFTGVDPEVGIGGVSGTIYPVSKRVSLGVNLSF
ncbi:SusC/RagA family TonB-linked outer membrane protein [Aestuariivivens insulae]|uniref:SusC/RagA family TonB-linked outer membrane protein n=1 Tax=Aestuariivivens insulae TaxID=1621988 RepID=UPI001F572A17|nr:TonB-dependent receptor [Aestuariivivens insulae]